jgi:outer membrane lipase/esterase
MMIKEYQYRKIGYRFFQSNAVPLLFSVAALLVPGAYVTAGPSVLNPTQRNAADTVSVACPQGPKINSAQFQERCNSLAVASGGPANIPTTDNPEVLGAVRTISAEQIIAPGTQTTKISIGQVNTINAAIITRLATLQAGLGSGENNTAYAGLQPIYQSGGAAGDDEFSRLGVWINGAYNWGDVDDTFQEVGFDFNNWIVMAGADYRLTDNIVIGGAFTYLNSFSSINQNGGSVNNNSYTGSVYGSYYVTDSFFVDLIASYGGADFDIKRRIQYSVGGLLPDTVNTQAQGSPGGNQYAFGLSTGYDFAFGGFTLSPLVRFNYLKLQIDSYSETGGDGWAQAYNGQGVESLVSGVGFNADYAISTSIGVFVPRVHFEWLHEFSANARTITTRYLGDGGNNLFNVVTGGPDRDYFMVGGSVSAQFAYGISGFVDYNAIVGYNNITNNKIMLGTRIEF